MQENPVKQKFLPQRRYEPQIFTEKELDSGKRVWKGKTWRQSLCGGGGSSTGKRLMDLFNVPGVRIK